MHEYQAEVLRTARMDQEFDRELIILALGVAGEAGEVADMVKKYVGHGHQLSHSKLVKELGDVLWYVTALAARVNTTLEAVAVANTEKLRARYPEGWDVERSKNRVEGAK